MSLSAQAPPVPEPGDPELPGSPDGSGTAPRTQPERPARPLVVTGGIAACAAAASGLAVLTTLTAIGWITAPHVGVGTGLGGVLRTAALLWLVAHHVGFTVRGAGRIGMLPLGLVLLPGALLALAGRWVVRAGAVTRLRHVGYAAIALALPYALLSGALAVASRTAVAAPSLLQAVVAAFLLALVAGGLGAARGLAPWSRLVLLMPARPRSIIVGMLGAAAVVAAAGAVLAGASLAVHLPEVKAASDALAPGLGGALLLLLAQLAYVPNAIIWAVAYTLGPGFAFGTGTVIAPTGSVLGAVPAFPMLAALPAGSSPGPAWVPVLVLAMPYLAGVFAGVVTVRITPTPVIEAAPLWGFAAGAAAGALVGLAAAFSGGPLGNGRLVAVGPSGFQVGLVAILEIGVTAALAAAAANWLILRRPARAGSTRPARAGPGGYGGMASPHDRGVPGGRPPGQHRSPGLTPETDDADGHRIYLNPWAGYDEDREETEPDDRLPAALQDAELAADRVGELRVAGLLSGHRVRAAHAVVIGVQLRPEHREHQQPQRAERQAEAAEHDAAGRAAGACGAAAPGPPVRPGAEPDRRRPEQQAKHRHVDSAVQVAEPERQADHGERADGQRRQGTLPCGGVGRRQLPGRRHPSRLRPAPARWLVSGHRVYCASFADLPVTCLRVVEVSGRQIVSARLVVLVSGEGTNLQALIDACRDAGYGAQVVAVGADRDSVNGLARAERAGLPCFTVRLADYPGRQDWDAALTRACAGYAPDLIVLAGFMKLVGKSFLDAFGGRCVNTHPALLPSFPGTHGVRDALTHGVKVTGCTVLLVDDGVDAGPIVAQASVPVADDDDEVTLHERIKVAERALLVSTVGRMVREGWSVQGRKVRIGS